MVSRDRDEVVKILAEEKKKLEEEIQRLEEEIKKKRVLAEALEKILGEISFVPAKEYVEERAVERERYSEEELKSRKGEKLAVLYIGSSTVKIKPVIGAFDENIPPLRSFLIKRFFEGVRRKDIESGKHEDEAFSYEVVKDKEGNVSEIVLRNVNVKDPRLMREIKNSVKWTLERILERISS